MRRRRSKQEMKLLEEQGDHTVIVELQGSLFFGTKDQLYGALEPELKKCTYIIIDMRRVLAMRLRYGDRELAALRD